MFDDDYFEIDDELLAASDFTETNVLDNNTHATPKILCFYCNGEDSPTAKFHRMSFISNFDISYIMDDNPIISSDIVEFNIKLNESTFASPNIFNVLLNKARVNIQYLDMSSREDAKTISQKSYADLRLEVTSLLCNARNLTKHSRISAALVKEGLRTIRILLGDIQTMPIINILHTTNSTIGNMCSSPAYHLLHGQLEWRWLHLTAMLELEKFKFDKEVWRNHSMVDTVFEEHFQLLLNDLITLSIYKYNKLKLAGLLYSTPFSCTCVKELWLMLQFLTERLNQKNQFNPFWFYFNKALNNIQEGKSPYLLFETTIVKKRITQAIPNNWIQFSVWILTGISKLQGFSENGQQNKTSSLRIKDNFELLDNLFKTFLNSDPSEEQLRVNLYLIVPLIIEWWLPTTDIVMACWEYFHKKLNSPFFVPGAAPNTLAVINESVVGYLQQVKSKMELANVNPNDSSYSIFVFLLGKILNRLKCTEGSNQVNKILGRITSKFSATKLIALNETGIHNVVSLFLTLAYTSESKEMAQRIQNVLLQIPLSRLSHQRQISMTRGHVALLILFLEQRLDCTSYISKILEQINSIHLDEGHLTCMKMLADGFHEIYSNCETFERGEPLLLDSWIVKYLSLSSSNERDRILDCLNVTLLKIPTILYAMDPVNNKNKDNSIHSLCASYYRCILPYVKQIFTQKDVSNSIPDIAANLCLSSTNANYKFEDLFKYFIEANCQNIQTTITFLMLILSTDKMNSIEQSVIIKNWIRCNLCSNNYNKDLKSLTNIVVSLEEFQVICDAEAIEIVHSQEPLCTFFSIIGRSYENTTDFRKKYLISEKVHSYLASFDKYLSSSLESDDMKIYSMIGIIILHCSQIVYVKAKTSCFFNIVMFHYILPTDLLMGKPPKIQKAQAVHKILHVLFLGLEKLDFKTDNHLNKMLTNLIVKWLPHFTLLSSRSDIAKPFVKCIKENNNSMSSFVFEKIASNFLTLQRSQPHQYTSFVLLIYSDVLSSIDNDEDKIRILLNSSLSIIIEHAMMADESTGSSSIVLEFLEKLFKCQAYRYSETLKELVFANLKSITTKNLSFFSSFYFQFMMKLTKIDPYTVQNIMDHLKNQVSIVERLRGLGRDGRLRNNLDSLESAITTYLSIINM